MTCIQHTSPKQSPNPPAPFTFSHNQSNHPSKRPYTNVCMYTLRTNSSLLHVITKPIQFLYEHTFRPNLRRDERGPRSFGSVYERRVMTIRFRKCRRSMRLPRPRLVSFLRAKTRDVSIVLSVWLNTPGEPLPRGVHLRRVSLFLHLRPHASPPFYWRGLVCMRSYSKTRR